MSSAARVVGRAAMCARQLRAAGEDGGLFRDVRDELAGILRAEAVRVLSLNGVPSQTREDLAQAVTLTVLERIVAGAVEPGFEDGYLAVAAKNRARDWHREASGVYEKTDAYEEDFLAAPGPDPYGILEQAEDERGERALVEQVVHVLHTAPARYREVLIAVYLEGVPIDVLVDREIFREGSDAGSLESTNVRAKTRAERDAQQTIAPPSSATEGPIAVRRRARARVDKLLQRARDWVRARVLAPRTTPPPPMNDNEVSR